MILIHVAGKFVSLPALKDEDFDSNKGNRLFAGIEIFKTEHPSPNQHAQKEDKKGLLLHYPSHIHIR